MKPRSIDENPFADLNLNLLQRKVHDIHLFMDFSPRYPGIRVLFFLAFEYCNGKIIYRKNSRWSFLYLFSDGV